MNLSGLFSRNEHTPEVLSDIRKYIGPGLLVTIGFIDPGNHVAAGSLYDYRHPWMVTLSTIMLILLQHNSAHLGIVTGECISEAAARCLPGLP